MAMNPFQKAVYTMMRLMARMTPSCKDISALISQSMDTRLPLRKRFAIQMHVAMCSLCRRYEKQLQLMRRGLHHYANPDENAVAESLSAEARKRLQQALETGGR